MGRVLLFALFLPVIALAAPPTSTQFFPARYYPDSPDLAGAAPISLRPGETSPPLILMPIPAGGALLVRVLDEAGAPVAGILVEAVAGRFRAAALTGGDGRATVTGVPAGEAVIRTRPDDPRSETGAFALRYAPGVADPAQAARLVIVDQGRTDAGEMRIPGAGRIKAAVLRPNRQSWSDLPVVLRSTDGAVRRERLTDTAGRVTFGGLEPGTYRLWADARGTDAVSECSNGTRDTLAAAPIEIVRESLVSGIVIETDRGGEIRGAIRDLSSNDGLPGLEVRFHPVDSPAATYRFVTDAIGFYFAYGLPAGAYKIYVPAIRRWYPSSQTEQGARTIEIAEGEEIDGADVRGEMDDPCRLAPQSEGVIEGGVQADFTRLPGAEIIAWDGPDTFRVKVTETSIYRIGCLPAGNYFVSFVPDGVYLRQYHPLTNDPAGARSIGVAQGDTSRGANFFPTLGAVLEGSVISDADGIGMAQVPVFARNPMLGTMSRTVTDKDGLFKVDRLPDRTGLPAGEWFVATDSIAMSSLVATPVLVIGLEGERIGNRARLLFLIPDGMSVHGWSLERGSGGTDPIIVSDAISHADGAAAREYVDPIACGSCRYRLTVTTERSGEEIDLHSDWLDVVSVAAGPRSPYPHPWSGSGWLRLPRAVAPRERVELYGPDGARVARLAVDGDRVAFDGKQTPASGVYFLRYRGDDGRDHAMRLVLRR